jgi:ribokinase
MSDPLVLAVAGSANLDLVVEVDHHPVTGETVLGGDHARIPGGKGANQAVAAARLGTEVAFIGRVGDDAAGEQLRASLSDARVDLTHLGVDAAVPSGIAMIGVDRSGDNAIIVSPGANARLEPAHIVAAEALLQRAAGLLLQLETPLDTVLAAARAASGIVVLDPAPAQPLPAELLAAVDVLVPNETELALLSGQTVDPDDVESVVAAARSLGVATVVVTLGAAGAVVVTASSATEIPAPVVTPIDTTAAGDAFRAALAIGLVSGDTPETAAAFAVRVGAAATLRAGAQPSLPTRSELEDLLDP